MGSLKENEHTLPLAEQKPSACVSNVNQSKTIYHDLSIKNIVCHGFSSSFVSCEAGEQYLLDKLDLKCN